jgi:hypothetical protein
MTSFAHQVRGAHQMSLFYDSVALPSFLLLRGFFVPSLKYLQCTNNQQKRNKCHKKAQRVYSQYLTNRPFGDPSVIFWQSFGLNFTFSFVS